MSALVGECGKTYDCRGTPGSDLEPLSTVGRCSNPGWFLWYVVVRRPNAPDELFIGLTRHRNGLVLILPPQVFLCGCYRGVLTGGLDEETYWSVDILLSL